MVSQAPQPTPPVRPDNDILAEAVYDRARHHTDQLTRRLVQQLPPETTLRDLLGLLDDSDEQVLAVIQGYVYQLWVESPLLIP